MPLELPQLDERFAALSQSRFRSRFRLGEKEQVYLAQKGVDTIMEHGRKFIEERLAPADPKNDGRQTPMQGHPIFIAQHATATCCRSCLAKWHGIEAGVRLNDQRVEYVLRVIRRWIQRDESDQQVELSNEYPREGT